LDQKLNDAEHLKSLIRKSYKVANICYFPNGCLVGCPPLVTSFSLSSDTQEFYRIWSPSF